MAFNKNQKKDMLAQYEEWLRDSQAVYLMSFDHMSMTEVDALRAQVREAGGSARIVKNTLLQKALKGLDMEVLDDSMIGTTLAGFAFEDAAAMAKAFSDAVKTEAFTMKCGYLDGQLVDATQIKALAALPPLPVMRAMLLSTFLAPATKFVRTLAEPARSLAAVTKAYSEEGAAA